MINITINNDKGAIGSDFKIDASYLSPNVNMASRLEVLYFFCKINRIFICKYFV